MNRTLLKLCHKLNPPLNLALSMSMKQHLIFRFQVKQLFLVILFCVYSIFTHHEVWGQDSSSNKDETEQTQLETSQVAEVKDQVEPIVNEVKSVGSDRGITWQNAFQGLIDDLVYYNVNKTKSRLRPDIQNGLIRVAVLTTQGSGADEASRQAIAQKLALLMNEVPNVHILEPSREQKVLKRFSRNSSGLKLTVERSISLGQHLGVRYLLLSEITSESNDSLIIKAQLISVKGRGEIKSAEFKLSKQELNKFRSTYIFYEKKLEATWRSAVLPGWGQLYQGNTSGAIAYMTLSASLLVGGIWATQQGDAAATEYQKNTSDKIYYRQIANNHYARAQLLWGALGATWLSATLSTYLQGTDKAHLKFNVNPAQGSLGLSGVF